MKLTNLPKAEPALDPKFLKNLGIKSYDADNLYPQNVRNIVLNSKTGSGCLERYTDYIEGRGIASEPLAGFVVNLDGETLADLHAQVSSDLAMHDGFAIHVNYDINARIVSLHHVPFENARIAEPDEEGNVRKVALHPDWTADQKRQTGQDKRGLRRLPRRIQSGSRNSTGPDPGSGRPAILQRPDILLFEPRLHAVSILEVPRSTLGHEHRRRTQQHHESQRSK